MCLAPTDRDVFFAKGRAKGWAPARIERAWAAHEAQRGREDARILNKAPAPKPLAVGDHVRVAADAPRSGVTGEILAIDGTEAWVKFAPGHRDTIHVRHLERVFVVQQSAASNQAYPYYGRQIFP